MIVVLTYHSVSDLPYVHAVPARRFRWQMRLLRLVARPLPLGEAVAALRGGRVPKGRQFAVTFDDGLRDNATNAAPILRAQGVPATVFVVSSLVGTGYRNPKLADPLPMLSAEELRGLDGEGLVRIEAHTHSHRTLVGLGTEELRDEYGSCQAALGRTLGRLPRLLAYPKGAYDAAAKEVARGFFDAAFSTGGTAILSAPVDLFAIPRVVVDRSFPFWKLLLMMFPAYWRLRARVTSSGASR